MKSEPLLRWRHVVLAILIPLGLATGAKLAMRYSRERAEAAASEEKRRAAGQTADAATTAAPAERCVRTHV